MRGYDKKSKNRIRNESEKIDYEFLSEFFGENAIMT